MHRVDGVLVAHEEIFPIAEGVFGSFQVELAAASIRSTVSWISVR
jgi:hypothetical protein